MSLAKKLKLAARRRALEAVNRAGYALETARRHTERERETAAMYRALVETERSLTDWTPGVTGVVFSKDRPVQLDCLLASFLGHVQTPCPLIVLYTSDIDSAAAVYDALKQRYAAHDITFIREERFKPDLCRTLNAITTERLFFLVDDIVFKEPFSLDFFLGCDPTRTIASLRHGEHLDYSYTQATQQARPTDLRYDAQSEQLSWQWGCAELDWGYATSVDGHIFTTAEMRVAARHGSYKAPNSFEDSLSRLQTAYAEHTGLAAKRSVIVNIPANRVQTENANISGDLSPESLIEKWRQGYELDWRAFTGVLNRACHEELDYRWKQREDQDA